MLEEAADMDGAGHWTILFKVLIPLSLPVLASVTLFVAVAHWNAWFDGLILMNSPDQYPLQSYLQTVGVNPDPRMLTERDLALLKIDLRNDAVLRVIPLAIGRKVETGRPKEHQ